ncbi:hypothetical protein P3X46_005491 [Hevea brasiliensis]|uniref:FRIGIDA-like protein n=2 Tax=Hevea brasiliensis TaxID=3981 RepID=A0ABQ9N3W6_HEVBR|nr:hypothetical protein P3X46_005491 [Hevea brasiliensis]
MGDKKVFVPMENIMDHLKLAELKKENLRESFDQAHAQASSILLFTLQWKDLEDQFDSLKNSLLKQAQEVDLEKEKLMENTQVLEQRDQEVEIKFKWVNERLDELQMKEKQLDLIKKLIQECTLELSLKENQLNLARKEVEDCNGKVSMKKEQLGLVQKELDECNEELSVKKKQLVTVQKSIVELTGELELKEMNLGLVKMKVEECCKELFAKDQQLGSVQKSLHECSKELETKESDLEKVKILTTDCNDELELKERELDALKNLISDCKCELKLNEKQLGMLQELTEKCSGKLDLKESQVGQIQKSIDQCLMELDLKKKELDATQKMTKECQKEVNLKMKELSRVQILIKDMLDDLHSKENHLDSIKALIEENTEELEAKEQQYDAINKSINECSAKLTMKEKEMELIEKSIRNLSSKRQSEEKKLDSVEMLIEESLKDLDSKMEHLDSIKVLIEEKAEELEAKEKQHDAIKNSINECSAKLKMKETEVELIEKSIRNLSSKLQAEEKKLDSVQKLIEERLKDLGSKEKHLDSIKMLIEENAEELEAKEKQHDAIKNSINDCCAELTLKEKEVERIEKSIIKFSSKLQLEEKKLHVVQKYAKRRAKEFNLKEKELSSLKDTMKTYCVDLELKDREYNAVRESIGERNEELKLKKELLQSVQISIIECSEELEAMKKQRSTVQKSIAECSEELESKKKSIDLMEKSLKECSDNLALKEAELDSIQRFHKEHEEKKKYFDSLERTLEECWEKLQMKERQFEESVKKFELEREQFDLMQKSVEERCKQLELKEKQLNDNFHSQLAIVQPGNLMLNNTGNSLSVGCQNFITNDGQKLQLLLNEHLRNHDLVHNEVFTAIQKSPDPGKLVLDAMHGFYPQGLKKGDVEFDLSVIRRSCTTLLEQLLKVSPQIKPEIKQQAMKLAGEWKARMSAVKENSLEVLGFLQLLGAFKLYSAFSPDEIQSLLDTVSQHRQAPELRQAFGNAESLSGSNNSFSHVKVEQMEHLHVSDPVCSSSANFQSTVITEGSFLLFQNEELGEYDLKPQEVLAVLKFSPDPAKFVLDVMQGSYFHHWKNEGGGLDASVFRSKVLLLEQLMKVSPKISPPVKEAAKKLAVSWKVNIGLQTENQMEVWAFLLFLAIYGLVSFFGGDEILGLIDIVAHLRQAPEICRILGFTAKIFVLVQNLLQRKQHIEAARFSYAYGLVEDFSPEVILQKHVDNIKRSAYISLYGKDLPEAQVEAIDKGVAALRTILECVADYKLESRFPTQKVTDLIVELEKQKASIRGSLPAPPFVVQPQVQGGNNHTIGTSGPKPSLHNQNSRDRLQFQGNNKRPKISFLRLVRVLVFIEVLEAFYICPVTMMGETISSELNLSELRKQSIRRTIDQLQDRASSILMLTLQWREREEHFESTHNAIDGRAAELHPIQESVEQNLKDVKKREKELEVVRESVNGRLREIVAREKEFELSQRKEIEERKRMIERIEKSRRKLEVVRQSTRRKLRELKDAEEKLELFNISNQEKADDIRVIERELNERLKGVEAKEKKCEHFFSELKVKEKQVEDHSKELALRDEHFSGRFIELELKLELKEENLGERCAELKLKDEKVEERFKELELKEKHIQTRCEEMELENKKLMERCEELELKEKQLENRCRELELVDKEFTERVKEFELEERQLEERFKKFYLKEKQLVNSHMNLVKIEPPQSHANIHFSDRKSLQMFLNDHCKDYDLMRNEVLNALRLSSDPTKLVLDAMEGFYAFNLKKGDFVFEKPLLEGSISPEIRPDVKKDAMELAIDWITKMKVDAEHSLQVLGFLQLLATYGLASAFDTDELLIHLEIVAQHAQAPELFRAIRFIYAFELVNEFPPVPLLEIYLEDSRSVARKGWRGKSIQAQIEAMNKRVINIRAALGYIEDYEIKSKLSPKYLRQQIRSLEDANSTRKALLAAKPPSDRKKCFAPKVAAAICGSAPQSESIRSPALISPTKASTMGPASAPSQQQGRTKGPCTAVSVNDDPIASSPATAITDHITTFSPSTGASTAASASAFSSSATTLSTVGHITAASISPAISSPLATIPKTGTDKQVSKKHPRIAVSRRKAFGSISRVIHPMQSRFLQPASLFMVHGAPYLNTTARHHSLRGYPPLNL